MKVQLILLRIKDNENVRLKKPYLPESRYGFLYKYFSLHPLLAVLQLWSIDRKELPH